MTLYKSIFLARRFFHQFSSEIFFGQICMLSMVLALISDALSRYLDDSLTKKEFILHQLAFDPGVHGLT